MGLEYFISQEQENMRWGNITREERYFCSHLYHYYRGKENNFIKLVDKKDSPKKSLNFSKEELKEDYYWELGYEVCFYRDYSRFTSKTNDCSKKRTFDLCLFSPSRIIIIEAKAHGGFKDHDFENLGKDITAVKETIGKQGDDNFTVNTVGICSSRYNCRKTTRDKFDLMITWKDIYLETNDKVFHRADEIYNN